MENRSGKMITLAQVRSVEDRIFRMRWYPAYLQTRLDEDKTSNAMGDGLTEDFIKESPKLSLKCE